MNWMIALGAVAVAFVVAIRFLGRLARKGEQIQRGGLDADLDYHRQIAKRNIAAMGKVNNAALQNVVDELRDIELRMSHELKAGEPAISVVVRTARQLETIERHLKARDAASRGDGLAGRHGEATTWALTRASLGLSGAAEQFRGSPTGRERALRSVSTARRLLAEALAADAS